MLFTVEGVPAELPRVLEGLSVIAVGTRDADLQPSCVYAVGLAFEAPGLLTVYVPETAGAEALRNIAENGRVAAVFEKPMTHKTVQVKGRCVAMRPAGESDRAAVDGWAERFAEDVIAVGVPIPQARRLRRWPCRAVTLEVTDVFEQSPGPHAGERLTAGGRA
ncbi:MAG: pyridoxamine 5'-phosphate oxidase family protein [Acidithiobacillales bacterium]